MADLYKKTFDFLKSKGFDVYPPYIKTGHCTDDYIVLKKSETIRYMNFSTDIIYYDILCYSKNYTSVIELSKKLKTAMNGYVPQMYPAGNETEPFYDESVKGYMVSVLYRAFARNKNVKTYGY